MIAFTKLLKYRHCTNYWVLSANAATIKAQPMIPAHDFAALHVFAGTWQSPADL